MTAAAIGRGPAAVIVVGIEKGPAAVIVVGIKKGRRP